ncbi:TRAP-type C4-dicarboxylate transport system, small permease component [Paracoccus isoporae]|uniref:TRAP transporter small permease protein n=2 Tax=Paracoccus isoporae TaxID=591205 RepID=A0A1G6TZR5_9RHOB|nr:TRAP-type C4-dicarboxylate transport system, small permease component [Paracoccus isoporae]
MVISDGLVRVERWASRLLVTAFVTLIVANVAMRYVLTRPIVFAEELAAILLVWLAFTATSITIHDRSQIGVTLLTGHLPRPFRHSIDLAVRVIVAAILAVLLWTSLTWVRSPAVSFEQIITTGWPKAPFFWIVPIFAATALIHVLAQLAQMVAEGSADEAAGPRKAEI